MTPTKATPAQFSQHENIIVTQIETPSGAIMEITRFSDGKQSDAIKACEKTITDLFILGYSIPGANNGKESLPAHSIKTKIEDGKRTHRILGGPGTHCHKFGISIWPEVMKLFGEEIYAEIQKHSEAGTTYQLPPGWKFVVTKSDYSDKEDDGKTKIRSKATALVTPDGELLELTNGNSSNGNGLSAPTPKQESFGEKQAQFYATLLKAFNDGKIDKVNAGTFKKRAKSADMVLGIEQLEIELKAFIENAKKAAEKPAPTALFSETREKLKKEIKDMLGINLISEDEAVSFNAEIDSAVSKDDLAAIAGKLKEKPAPGNPENKESDLPF